MKMVQLTLALLRYSLFVGLLLQPVAPSPLDDLSLQQLGLLLGLPVDSQQGPSEQQDAPTFVKDMYNCWSSNQAGSCLPGYHGSDVNLLRTSLGTEDQTAPPALHSFNTKKELKNTLPIFFDISLTLGQSDIIRYAMLRVYRESLSTDRLATLRESCGNLSQASLHLYTQTGTKGSSAVFTLAATQPLSEVDFSQEGWVEFYNLTDLYRDFVEAMHKKSPKMMKIKDSLHARLALSCPSLSPSDLGFGSVSENRAQLLGFEENSIQEDFIFSKVMSHIAKKQVRSRRQAEVATANDTSAEIPQGAPQPQHLDHYGLVRCQLYHHEISFHDQPQSLDFSSVIVPHSYTANFCAGHCQWPPSTSQHLNRHAFIQAYANSKNPNVIPEPCCVPRPGSMQTITALISEGSQVVMKAFADVVATGCDCL